MYAYLLKKYKNLFKTIFINSNTGENTINPVTLNIQTSRTILDIENPSISKWERNVLQNLRPYVVGGTETFYS